MTQQQPSGLNLSDAGASILKDIFKMESLGDRKRVLETVSKKRIELIQFPPIPVLSQDKQETNKVLSWNHQDVFNWISDQEIEIKKNIKKHKITGRQLLSLNDEEIEKELGMNKENKEKLKRIIEKLKKDCPVEIEEELMKMRVEDVPDELKCPITKKLMEDPVVASDGGTYERAAVEEYLREKRNSPLTDEPFEDDLLRTNKQIKKKIETFLSKK